MEDGERGGREQAETTDTQNGREGDRERQQQTQSHITSSIQHFVVAVLPFFIFLFRDVSKPVKPKLFLLGGLHLEHQLVSFESLKIDLSYYQSQMKYLSVYLSTVCCRVLCFTAHFCFVAIPKSCGFTAIFNIS